MSCIASTCVNASQAYRDVPGVNLLDFRGPAVQGKRGQRFVYLTWGNLGGDGSFTMFRRAKIMLSDVLELVGREAGDSHVVATVDLTDNCGGPRCARLRPPALALATGNTGGQPGPR